MRNGTPICGCWYSNRWTVEFSDRVDTQAGVLRAKIRQRLPADFIHPIIQEVAAPNNGFDFATRMGTAGKSIFWLNLPPKPLDSFCARRPSPRSRRAAGAHPEGGRLPEARQVEGLPRDGAGRGQDFRHAGGGAARTG